MASAPDWRLTSGAFPSLIPDADNMGIHSRQTEMMDPEGVWAMQRHKKTRKMEKAKPSSTDPSGSQLYKKP